MNDIYDTLKIIVIAYIGAYIATHLMTLDWGKTEENKPEIKEESV